ncbi:hypothetical protein [Qipengyuania oceanensis]|uniref:Uncharacterized protein n=1 Tax=Qipengyuania oceanensis TaxID=1463597 RepID=A0A844YKH0_9SPHN|nr:hypothetical protein [Qipengyuania oceanensis]MXO63434.1 hypothetical protein [Qipengyuania oceanensis]
MSTLDLEHALKPWDGSTWFVEQPADFVRGLYRLHQIEAHDLLMSGRGLSNWAAGFLQQLYYQSKPPTQTQWFWLRKLDQEHGERVAA